MTLEGDCVQDDLTDGQRKYYSSMAKAHELSMNEVDRLKKDAHTISKIGNVCFVKSTYHVKVQNTTVQPPPAKKTTAEKMIVAQPGVKLNSPQQKGATNTTTNSQQQKSTTNTTTNSQQSKNFQLQTVLKPSTNLHPALMDLPSTSAATKKVVTSQTKYPEVNAPSTSSATPVVTLSKKTTQVSAEDVKNISKSIPSLAVVVRPSKTLSELVMQKKRDELDTFVKSRLILDPRRFAEWLMQVRLVRSQQSGLCRYHPSNSIESVPSLQLGMYNEEGKFPHSGGYVWISKCCDKNFVSIFRESIFENSAHPPTILLKLIYHWACQTTVNNVILWVKVDRLFLRTFYAMLRSVCTVQVHTTTPVFCANKNGRVEIGVISLGTTSADGKRRDVKVEVLGVYDQETKKFRLRASEPIYGDSRSRARFARILEPLTKWVSPKAMILTDFTVDRTSLQELGFYYIVQKTLSTVTADDRLNNRTIMEYLRRTVPKVFQNTLSLLSTACIQQFLDELVWRENQGLTSADAFHNILRDLGSQAQVDTGMPLINRLSLVTVDPFKDWNLNVANSNTAAPTTFAVAIPSLAATTAPTAPATATAPAPAATTTTTSTPSSSGQVAIKRSAPVSHERAGSAKEMRIASCYSTYTPPKQSIPNAVMEVAVPCQRPNCRVVLKTNLEMMAHLRLHFVTDTKKPLNIDVMENCNYCLESFVSPPIKKMHEESMHIFMSSFKIGGGKEDSAIVRDCVCLICHDKFSTHRLLEQHLERAHVSCEMPYRCRVCKYQTSVHSQLIDHFSTQHKTSCFLLCPLCLDTFTIESDNTCTGFSTGHFQYLAHMKSHSNATAGARNRCKACLLTFLHPKQLQYHVQMDHKSMLTNLATRPFNFTITKPVGRHSSSATSQPPSSSLSEAKTHTSSTSTPLKQAAAATSTSKNSASKTGAKGNLQEIDADLVPTLSRRYPHFLLNETTLSSTQKCIECSEDLKKKNHFPGYMCCPDCRFSTSCAAAMKKHHIEAHTKTATGKPKLQFGSVFTLSESVWCKCGFTSACGLDVGRHFAECRYRYVTLHRNTKD